MSSHTLVGTEAPLAVIIIGSSGGTPYLPIIATGAGTALVFVTQEGEGEDAWGTFGIPTHCRHSCGIRDTGQGAAEDVRSLLGNNDKMLTLTSTPWVPIHPVHPTNNPGMVDTP